MGDGMTKEEAMDFVELKGVVNQTHGMVTDLHNCLHKNGFIKQVEENTRFRKDHQQEIKDKRNYWLIFNRTIATGVALLAITALAKYIFTGSAF